MPKQEQNPTIAQGSLTKLERLQKIECEKRTLLEEAINTTLPHFASNDKDLAIKFAREILKDIQQGHNPDLEPDLRQKAAELGIELDDK